ncbi:MAG: MFS transporter [Thermoanaerobaculia bacterium]|nr:MFS transporter [Thermoanaerobaculia bacterium]
MSFVSSWLERFGLHRPELRAWAMYDWANSAFVLVVITAVFPIYYESVAAAGGGLSSERATEYLGYATTLALLVLALTSPVLGALADFKAWRKKLLMATVGVGALATAGLFTIGSGDWQRSLIFFAIGNFCLFLSFVFYDSLLPHIASGDELDRVSTAGYAVGYLGSGLLLTFQIFVIQNPGTFGFADGGAATRWAFLGVALWWAVFTLPLLLRVKEPPRALELDEAVITEDGRESFREVVKVTFQRLGETLREIRHDYRQTFLMLVAYMIYNEGIGTIIRMGGIFAASKDFSDTTVITAILLLQFVGIPFAFLFGGLAAKLGTKRTIMVGLSVYVVISILGYLMETENDFFVMCFLIALVQGGTQGLSRSLFGSMVPKHKASEFFGFFSVFSKVAGIFGPLLFALAIRATGSLNSAVLSVVVLFVAGAILLLFVDVEAGQRQAREMDESLLAEPTVGEAR